MSRIECKYESEILDAVASGRWPDRLDAELRDHASSCSICSEVAMVSTMYRDEYALAMDQVRVPSAGLVWWKSELRARREAVRVASRPITLVTGIAGTCAIAVLAVLLSGILETTRYGRGIGVCRCSADGAVAGSCRCPCACSHRALFRLFRRVVGCCYNPSHEKSDWDSRVLTDT